jgi:aminoglycoside phosphotransferase (APT) family kinase protein
MSIAANADGTPMGPALTQTELALIAERLVSAREAVHAPLQAGLMAVKLSTRLSAAVPVQRATSIVHGDYRIDNTLLAIDSPPPRVLAVVDWELSTIGDPVADVAMMCAYRQPYFDRIVGEPSAWTSTRLPGIEDLAGRYADASGAALADWDFHLALAYFKVAAIAAGIDHRRRAGAAAGSGFDTAGECVEPFLRLGLEQLKGF